MALKVLQSPDLLLMHHNERDISWNCHRYRMSLVAFNRKCVQPKYCLIVAWTQVSLQCLARNVAIKFLVEFVFLLTIVLVQQSRLNPSAERCGSETAVQSQKSHLLLIYSLRNLLGSGPLLSIFFGEAHD
jgi:hypothetical protein